MRNGRRHGIAEDFPVLTEVIGIHHPVGYIIGIDIESAHHGIDTIVRTHLRAVALHNATATKEHRLDFSPRSRAVKLFINVFGDVVVLRESLTAIVRNPASNSIRRFATRIPK